MKSNFVAGLAVIAFVVLVIFTFIVTVEFMGEVFMGEDVRQHDLRECMSLASNHADPMWDQQERQAYMDRARRDCEKHVGLLD